MLGRLVSMTILGFVVANRPMDNWCSAARGVGVSGGYIDIVPYIGAFVSAVPSLLLAVSINLDLAVYVVLLYIVVHLIEGYIRVPLVQRRVVPLPPALTLSAQIILGVVAGFLGLLLATPLVAAIVIIRMVYVEDVLGDHTTTERSAQKNMASCGDSGGDGASGSPAS